MSKEEEKIYTIKNLSSKQLDIISKALEFYVRTNILQFETVIDNLFNWNNASITIFNSYIKNRNEIEKNCKRIRKLLVTEDSKMSKFNSNGNWSLGIASEKTTLKTKIAYEMMTDILSFFNDKRESMLKMTNETDIIIKEENLRKEKLSNIIENINKIKL